MFLIMGNAKDLYHQPYPHSRVHWRAGNHPDIPKALRCTVPYPFLKGSMYLNNRFLGLQGLPM